MTGLLVLGWAALVIGVAAWLISRPYKQRHRQIRLPAPDRHVTTMTDESFTRDAGIDL